MVNIDLKLQQVNPFYYRIARPALISSLIQLGRFSPYGFTLGGCQSQTHKTNQFLP